MILSWTNFTVIVVQGGVSNSIYFLHITSCYSAFYEQESSHYLIYLFIHSLISCGPVLFQYAQLCLTLSDPLVSSPPGSSVCGIFQARILEWVPISYSRGSSGPRDWIHISCASCTGSQIHYHCSFWDTLLMSIHLCRITTVQPKRAFHFWTIWTFF